MTPLEAAITKTTTGFRVVADGGASADFTCDRGDIVVSNCVNCGEGFMRSALASAWGTKNRPVVASAPVVPCIPMSRRGQLAYDAAMSDLIQKGMDRQLRATRIGA